MLCFQVKTPKQLSLNLGVQGIKKRLGLGEYPDDVFNVVSHINILVKMGTN